MKRHQLAGQRAADEHGLAAAHHALALVVERVDAAGFSDGALALAQSPGSQACRNCWRCGSRAARSSSRRRSSSAGIPRIEPAAEQLEAQQHQIGVEHVGLAVVAHRRELAGQYRVPDLLAGKAELARKSQQRRHVGQRGAGARLEAREHVHEIEVPPVIAAQVIVVAKAGVVVARLPVARRLHARLERAVVEHRQVEAATVPGHQVRRVLVDAVEEARDQLRFRGLQVAERPDPQLLAAAQHAGDRDHPMLLERQEIAAAFLAAQRVHGLRHLRIVQALEAVEAPAELHVRHGLDVEHQGVHRRPALARALRRPLEHRHRHDQSGLVGERHVPGADAELAAQALAARRVDHLGLAPVVLHHADIADPHAVRKAGAHGLDDRLLGGEAHGEEALRPRGARQLRLLVRQQQPVDEVLAETRQRALDARQLQHVDADAVDHPRARCICARISRTAAARPSNTAWAMMAWPMLSSMISGIAATGPTLR